MIFMPIIIQGLLTIARYTHRTIPSVIVAVENNNKHFGGNVPEKRVFSEDYTYAGNQQGLCSTTVIKLSMNVVKVSPKPIGLCQSCCPLQIDHHIRFLLYKKPVGPIRKFGDPLPIPAGYYYEGNSYEALPTLSTLGVDPQISTVIYIHGFLETVPGKSGNTILEGYASRQEPYNLIILDWSMLTTAPWYAQAIENVRVAAKVLADFLQVAEESGEMPLERVHLIGFSLGAHVAGIAGKLIRKRTKRRKTVTRITGLDPALPGYSIENRMERLTYTDARYVDVIHTDGGLLGFPFSVGHADFYPNNGKSLQPGCEYQVLLRSNAADDVVSCSHQRSWFLYSESIKNPQAFPSTKCQNWYERSSTCDFSEEAFMGFGSSKNNTSRGNYFLVTNGQEPYAKSSEEQRLIKNK